MLYSQTALAATSYISLSSQIINFPAFIQQTQKAYVLVQCGADF
jgi:hypothetical protein